MDVGITFDSAEFGRLADAFRNSPEIFAKAVRAALRRTGANLRKNVRSGIKSVSYFKSGAIAQALGKLQLHDMEVELTVAGSQAAGHKFRMVPNRVTARKGMRSVNWPSPGVQIGPGEPVRHASKTGFSKPFIANVHGLKAMCWREKATGKLSMPTFASPQYFAAFDRVKDPVLNEAEKTFLARLEHEIDYRLGLK